MNLVLAVMLTRDMVLLSLSWSLFSKDSVISGMVVMRFSGLAVLGRLSSNDWRREALGWGLTSAFSSLVLGAGAIVAAWSLFNFIASNCDCREVTRGEQHGSLCHNTWHNVIKRKEYFWSMQFKPRGHSYVLKTIMRNISKYIFSSALL